ncbi:PREDICTED: U11/U12 small nuclear ribonucleoprotein 48 kDa protein-like [Camelina sativa]|uniref:U11/U12 small nuclear ribonucleoprotein 48 kDa protein-like n=1 Tax=Camelina sativa TaxID=90675 RepID=A0ABM0SL72_CAMSA|nr:PREDICTED: U11/U12 small nuclear ribonucleoprotein 48 kDa protein-like [Camelina sativa]XP_010412838.1 PREDICTED: U11/U12 small nuclear ribonucleoprotein 48 kDa protein-like [Camelina sativa]
MDRPPSFPHYQNPNLNFFHHRPPPNPNPNFFFRPPPPPLQNLNTHPIAPSPPPIRELSGTISSLQSLLSECQRTLDSLSQNLALDHSHLLQKDGNGGFVRCPFDSNHLMPPEALFLHSLGCPNPLDLTHLLGSLSSYRNTLELHCEVQLKDDGGDLCVSLDDALADFGTSFFYKDCPGAVSFSELDRKKLTLTLPNVLSVECSDLVVLDEKEKNSMLGILPSDLCSIKSEIDQWRDYPNSYSYSVLSAILGLNVIETSELSSWILVTSTRFGVIIDTYMRDHIFLLFRLCLKPVVKEACGFMLESDVNAVGVQKIMSCKSRVFECPVLVRVFSWLASQLAVLYGEGNGKFFALDMLKQCILESASQIMLFRSERTTLDDARLSNKDGKMEKPFESSSGGEGGKTLDSAQVISVSRVAAAVAALYERSMLEGKIRAIRYAQPLTRYQRLAELGVMTAKAEEERKRRSSYQPIIDHDGLPRQRSSNQDMNKMKTREELLAEERDYKRRRMSYRGKKVKRTPRQVLRDIIEGYTEEIKLAGGIGCFEKGMPLQSPSSVGNDQKESDVGYETAPSTLTDASSRVYKQWNGEKHADIEYSKDSRNNTDKVNRHKEYDSGSSQRQKSHRSYKHSDRRDDKHSDRRDDEFTRTKRHSLEKKAYHQSHRSSREKSSSDYRTRRDDPYDRRSREPRNQNSFEDRYNPTEKELT